jgi:ribosomal protein S18 acetylase RimI-like enzyme
MQESSDVLEWHTSGDVAGRHPGMERRTFVIQYRTFRNPDPPGLVELWNRCFNGRGTVPIRLAALLEYFIFAKPYFDPQGLILALDGDQPVGFAHAGFGPAESRTAVNHSVGVLCSLGVQPTYRRQGIGTTLLSRSEEYMRGHGATEILAGPLAPFNPFTFGLYGGSQSPGFLDSDVLARPFLEHRGYRPARTALVFQRHLQRIVIPPDPRFPAYRQRFEIHALPAPRVSWWQECVLGPIEMVEYRLTDRATGQIIAHATLWEMDTFSQLWNEHAIGIVDMEVVAAQRGQGLAKFLLGQILRHLHEQFFSLVEIHVGEENAPGVKLVQSLGFNQVDRGHSYRREG